MVDATSMQIRKSSTKIIPVLMGCIACRGKMKKIMDKCLWPMLKETEKRLEMRDLNAVKYILKEVQKLFLQFLDHNQVFLLPEEQRVPELINFLVKVLE